MPNDNGCWEFSQNAGPPFGNGNSWMYPDPNVPPMGNPYINPILWVFMGYNPQESLEPLEHQLSFEFGWSMIFSTQGVGTGSL